MSSTIERPVFHEGQILGANDLQQGLQYNRDENARHERYLHTWGLAHGLDVIKRGDDFFLQPGFATDSSGAPIVVSSEVALNPDQVRNDALLSGTDSGFFPMFLARAEEERTASQSIGQCNSSSSTRTAEKYAIRYRRIAAAWDENQTVENIASGPADAPESNRIVLVGFVSWDSEDGGKLTGFQRRYDVYTPRYAGVRADDVTGRGGTLTLRSRPVATSDAPVVQVDHHDEKKSFVVGLDNGGGSVNELLTVDAKGNINAKGNITAGGVISGGAREGDFSIESGLARDGVRLPLPDGVNEDDIGKTVDLHINVNPRPDLSELGNSPYLPYIRQCFVDEDRVVRCQIVWKTDSPISFPPRPPEPGMVEYSIMAVVPKVKAPQ